MSNLLAQKIAARLNLQPICMDSGVDTAGVLAAIEDFDEDRSTEARLRVEHEMLNTYGFYDDDFEEYQAKTDRKPFAFANGTAFIPIHGMLINRFGASWGFITGYNFIRSQIGAAMADQDVKRIVYDVDSGGGEVSGCQETADIMSAATKEKPSMAVVDSMSASAAYWLSSSAGKIVATPSSGAGSIGAMLQHVDRSKALENAGYKVTLLHSGAHKVDGNSFEALKDDVRESLQTRLDATREGFATHVASQRGLDVKAVMDTEAEYYPASEALAKGLVDEIASTDVAIVAFMGAPNGGQQSNMEIETVTEAEKAQAVADAQAAATLAATTRIKSILSHDEAKGRNTLAQHLAFNTQMSLEDAVATLTVTPKEVAAAPAAPAEPATPAATTTTENPFQAAMDKSKHPNVGEDDGAENLKAEDMTTAQKVAAIMNSQSAARGDVTK